MEESGMLNYDTLFVLEQVWSGGRMVHTESVMFSFLFLAFASSTACTH